MKKKEFVAVENYPVYYIDLATIMNEKKISKNHLCRMTGLAYSALQRYYKSEIKRLDLDVISRICAALNCEISDILKRQ
ncbi:helix-turn-helix transcriptional regulator [Hungatella sp.]|uniref:helix-turn-helix domain-containing protein n=1 Tax=Hungatella sp. TaxID=2613924 RepID=UPI002A820E9E|nr:helix-turn-helix transcriptional regulator [Hungatella sp.]